MVEWDLTNCIRIFFRHFLVALTKRTSIFTTTLIEFNYETNRKNQFTYVCTKNPLVERKTSDKLKIFHSQTISSHENQSIIIFTFPI